MNKVSQLAIGKATELKVDDDLLAQYEEVKKKYLTAQFRLDRLFQYQKWISQNNLSTKELQEQITKANALKCRPLISVIVPVYKTPIDLLQECLDSISGQTYDNWQICVVDDKSQNSSITNLLKKYAAMFPDKFKFQTRNVNGHISQASNDAIDIADGEFIALLDHDDILWPNALYEVAVRINKDKLVDLIYTDEDKLEDGIIHANPYTKPDYNEYFLAGCNYITHLAIIRTSLVRKIGGFRSGVEGAQDWDLFLRISSNTKRITHIPKILYSWRVIETSTAKGGFSAKPYAYQAQKKAVIDYYTEKGVQVVDATLPKGFVGWMIEYTLSTTQGINVYLRDISTISDVATLIQRIENDKSGININYVVVGGFKKKDLLDQNRIYFSQLNIQFVGQKKGRPNWKKVRSYLKADRTLVIKNIFDLQGEKGWLNNLVGYSLQQNVDAVAVPILCRDHTISSAGLIYNTLGVPLRLLEGYIRGGDQRLDTNLLSPRGVAAPDPRAYICKTEYLNSTHGNEDIVKMAQTGEISTVVYSPFVSFFTSDTMGRLSILKDDSAIELAAYSYDIQEDNPFWGKDYLVS